MPNEITIGEIGREGTTAASVRSFLAQCDPSKPLTVRIHSEGGEVFDGFAIYDAFKSYAGPKKCVIESAAFSIASYIAMAFEQVEIAKNGYLMIHNPWSMTEGDDEEHAKNAMLLAKLKDSMVGAYTEKTGRSAEDILSVMKNETYFNAQDALSFGLVNAITEKPVQARVFARSKNMPQRVFASLFEAGVAGDNREPTKGKTMSESQKPIAATVQDIKRKFPKAKADFIVKCMEKEMPLEEVAVAAMEETMAENETLAMKVQAMETELAALKAKALEIEVEPKEEEVMPAPAAKAKSGVAPVAKAKAVGGVSAKARWNDLIQAKVASGYDRSKATASVNKENPGLREQMLAEVNG
jgi:ATP-dependent protease ClpP protease subunit